jgi:predicted nucleic acid-binding protein
MIYFDSSALVKLIFGEDETLALVHWLDQHQGVPRLSSEIANVEVVRTCRRVDEESVAGARQLLAGLDLLVLSPDVVEVAALARPLDLGSLDAIHLATALSLGDQLSFFVAYDQRLSAAAHGAGLPVVAPS